MAAAGDAAGHPATEDYNGEQQEGFGRSQVTVRNGRRCSAAVAYLRPALRRPNLRIEIRALAQRVLFEGRRAVGLEYAQMVSCIMPGPAARSSSRAARSIRRNCCSCRALALANCCGHMAFRWCTTSRLSAGTP